MSVNTHLINHIQGFENHQLARSQQNQITGTNSCNPGTALG